MEDKDLGIADARLILGDCVEVMRELPECSVDAVVADPPYGLEFMGKGWDRLIHKHTDHSLKSEGRTALKFQTPTPRYQAGKAAQGWHEAWAREALRVLKPGGHLLAFGGTRTYHRLACAIEDAGFEIRDCIQWIYGSGFPKSKNLGNGFGTALKPAHEPIVMARKPVSEKSVTANFEKHGTGALNIDSARIGTSESLPERKAGYNNSPVYGTGVDGFRYKPSRAGRWPANLILSHSPECQRVGVKRVRGTQGGKDTPKQNGHVFAQDEYMQEKMKRSTVGHANPDGFETIEDFECVDGCPIFLLDQQSGTRKSGSRAAGVRSGMGFHGANGDGGPAMENSEGGASRFFACFEGEPGFRYVPKASKRERGEGNNHPTVKPLSLCRYLVKLVTPPGGVVLDPFIGSGTTGMAAKLEGFDFIGIEQDASYLEIARRRIAHTAEPEEATRPVRLQKPKPQRRPKQSEYQEVLDLFGEDTA